MLDEEPASEPRYYNFSDVPKFTSETAEDWTIFLEKLQFYFKSCRITDLELKKSILFAHTGSILYKQVRKLISHPKTTETISYTDAVDLLKKHYSPVANVWLSRKVFESRNQYHNESFKDFVSELKVLAEPCGFDNIEKALLQRVILGMKNLQLQERIFAEPHEEITWDSVTRRALSAEAAKQDVVNLHSATSEVHRTYSASTAAHFTVQGKQNTASQADRSPCNCCGASNHRQLNCWYKDSICGFCHIKGHIERACRKKAQASGSAERLSSPTQQPSQVSRGGKKWYKKKKGFSYDPNSVKEIVTSPSAENYQTYDPASLFMNNIRSIIAPPPILVDCLVNGVPLSFEVDCGSGHSIIGYDLYNEKFSAIKLADPQLEMKTWSHQNLKIAGVFEATVQRKSFTASLPLIVLKESGQSLLGRAWFHSLGIMVDILNKVPPTLPCPEILSTNLVSQVPSTPTQKLPPFLTEFQDVFAPGLGSYTGPPAHIHLKDNAVPIFCRPRPVPFALRDKVAAQLDEMVQDKIIEPVKFSEWSTPTVNLVKKDGTIRVCGDYSGTINPACKRDVYPLPTVDEILSKLNGGKKFAKLDLSSAFLQIPVDLETANRLTLTTHKGLFRVLRLCAGLSSAPAIFQQVAESVVAGLEGVVVYMDDLLIQAATEEELIVRLRKVIQRMRSAGLRLKLEKCIFNVNSLDYLGFRISATGIKPTEEKVETLLSAPSPTINVDELRSFLGFVTYYDRFIPDKATAFHPLYQLLQTGAKWKWGPEEESCVKYVKEKLASEQVLAIYDPSSPLFLDCDASPIGDEMVFDNAACLKSDEMQQYCSKNGIKQLFSAPCHPATNGQAERVVQTVKNQLKKLDPATWRAELPNIMLMLHVTPNPVTGKSPAELLMGRCPRTLMDRAHPGTAVSPSVESPQTGGRTLAEGQEVMYRNYSRGPQWLSGVVSKVCGARHYLVSTNSGMLIKRHIDQLISRKFTQSEAPSSLPNPKPSSSAALQDSLLSTTAPRVSISVEEPPNSNNFDIEESVPDSALEELNSTIQSEAEEHSEAEEGPSSDQTHITQPSPQQSLNRQASTSPNAIHRRVSLRVKRAPVRLKDFVKT